jgi:hypothetical protein
MIPIGAASAVLSGVSSAISSGLSKLTGQSSASEANPPSFAERLKTATSLDGLGNSVHHHHSHGASNTSANASPSASQTATGSSTTQAGSVINIIV